MALTTRARRRENQRAAEFVVSDKIDNRQQSGLVRALGPIDATMIVMGSMIGSGIFITSAESSRLSGAPGWLLLAWAVAGLLTITGALCCSELATMMPRAGGVYVFLREAYGHSTGFLYGWTLFLVIQTGTIAAVAIAFAKFLGVFVVAVSPENYLVPPISLGHYAISLSTEQLVAISLIALLTWSNTRGLEVGKIIQNTFTFAKTVALVAVVGLVGKWLEPADGSTWLHVGRRTRPRAAVRKIDGRPALRANRLDKRHVHWQRNTRSREKSRTGAGDRLRQRGHSLSTGQSRVCRCLAVPGNRACASQSRCRGHDEHHFRSSRCDVHGGGNHDFYLRVQQRSDTFRSPRLLCDGARPF